MSRMEIGVIDKLRQLEETINTLSKVRLTKTCPNNNTGDYSSHLRSNQEENREEIYGNRQILSSKLAKLEFPRFSSDDPTK